MKRTFSRAAYPIAVSVFCFIFGHVSAEPVAPEPRCGGLFDLCWYVDNQTKTEKFEQRFERARRFSEGLAAVRINGRFGFIDTTGEIVIRPRYNLVGDFFQGHAEVMIGEKTGVINGRGEIVLEPQFGRAIPFTKDAVLVKEWNWCCTELVGADEIFGHPLSESYASSFRLYHLKKGWLQNSRRYYQAFDTSGRGLIWARASVDGRSVFGLMRADGTWQIRPQYHFVSGLHNGIAIVGKSTASIEELKMHRPNLRYGAVDKDGNLVVPVGHKTLRDANSREHSYRPQNRKKYAGEHIINCTGGAKLYHEGPFWGIKGPAGKVLIKAEYRAISCFRGGVAWAAFDGKKAWCPIGVDGVQVGWRSCVKSYHPHLEIGIGAVSLHKDGYESSVLWTHANLDYSAGLRLEPPRILPGVQF